MGHAKMHAPTKLGLGTKKILVLQLLPAESHVYAVWTKLPLLDLNFPSSGHDDELLLIWYLGEELYQCVNVASSPMEKFNNVPI